MDGSARSSHGNAYFTGFGSSKRVVFFDTLLDRLNPDEIEAVLAHELGHFKHHHVIKRIAMMFFVSFLGLALLGWLMNQPWFYAGLGVTEMSNYMALVLFLLVSPVFLFILRPIMASYSRKNEFEADSYAATHADAKYLIEALVKLYRDNASTLTPDPLHSAFYDSHPPASIRISKLAAYTH
jgi:STE24 endopeptidase